MPHDGHAPERVPGAAAGGDRRSWHEHTAIPISAQTRGPGELTLALELAALDEGALVEQARLLGSLPPALTAVAWPRVRLLLAELATRLEARG